MDAPSPPSGEPLIPKAERDLRETFDLPLMMEADSAPVVSRGRQTADAVALFQDDGPARPRRQTGAEARSRARRCPKCGSTVPLGMSLCQFCGLDLDTGARTSIEEEELFTAPAPQRAQTIPVGIGIVGGITFVGSLVLGVVSLAQWLGSKEGYELLSLVCAFGMYASVQFVRGKSAKMLLIALTLGALIDIVGLIALPVYRANEEAALQPIVLVEDDEGSHPAVRPYIERLDVASIKWGIGLLAVYGGVVFYLMTPGVRKYFERSRETYAGPIQF